MHIYVCIYIYIYHTTYAALSARNITVIVTRLNLRGGEDYLLNEKKKNPLHVSRLSRERRGFSLPERRKVGGGKGGSEGRKSFEIQSDLVAIVGNDRGWGIV